jgi:predicted O-methyltransferase YrrM
MFKHLIYGLMAKKHLKSGIRQIRMLENKLQSRHTRFAIPFVYRGSGYFKKLEPRQNPFEIEELYNMVYSLAPKRVLEIGTARGGTLYLWTQAAADDAIIISVDLPGGEFGGAYPACRKPFYRSFARANQKLHLLRCDSHEKETVEKVRELFGHELIDFIFIDGDHSYDGVKADFRSYGPLVRPGGIIGLHDIMYRPELPEIQVHRFWNEIRDRYDTREITGPDGSVPPVGVGLIFADK